METVFAHYPVLCWVTMKSESSFRAVCVLVEHMDVCCVCVLFSNLRAKIDCCNHLSAIVKHKSRCTQ